MNRVPLSSADRSDVSLPTSSSLKPAGLAPITRTASEARNMSLRTLGVAAAGHRLERAVVLHLLRDVPAERAQRRVDGRRVHRARLQRVAYRGARRFGRRRRGCGGMGLEHRLRVRAVCAKAGVAVSGMARFSA